MLAAVLAVLGYSVNESVVVFDRIRENFRKSGMRGKTTAQVIDNAITATMSRTIIIPRFDQKPWCCPCWCLAARRCMVLPLR